MSGSNTDGKCGPVSRRSLMKAAGVVAAAGAAAQARPAAAQGNARKTFVLIHGAYHGGWCWQPLSRILEEKGHKVYAPSLTGNGDRMHLISKDITLDTQATDIVNLVTFEDLKGICLVAHSFGGWPVSQAIEKIHDRVASVVLLDAFKPKDKEKPLDYISPHSRKALEEAMARGEAGRKAPPAKLFSVEEKLHPWIAAKMTDQPNGPAFSAISLTGKLETIARKTYIRAPKYPQAAFDKALAECKADATWQTFVNDTTGHDVMVDQPQWLADLLMKVA